MLHEQGRANQTWGHLSNEKAIMQRLNDIYCSRTQVLSKTLTHYPNKLQYLTYVQIHRRINSILIFQPTIIPKNLLKASQNVSKIIT